LPDSTWSQALMPRYLSTDIHITPAHEGGFAKDGLPVLGVR